MNLKEKFKQGIKGLNFGLPTGLKQIDIATGGVQRASLYGIAAGPKVGKTTFTDSAFVINPYLYYLDELAKGNPLKLEIEWIYFSFEIDRVKKEFKYIAFFMYHDYKIETFRHKDSIYEISPTYLEGKMRDNDNELITVSPAHQEIVYKIYEDRIIPLFGEYDVKGRQIKKGLIRFVEYKENPTGLRNYIGRYSAENGTWNMVEYKTSAGRDSEGNELFQTKQRRDSWIPNNPEKYTIIVLDHLRKLKQERGFAKKQTVDKMIEYQVEFRNWCGFTFVDIIHLNRGMSDVTRLKYNNEFIYPTGDDIKETGNLSEEADYIFTMMNPNDEKYGLNKHFGLQIKSNSNEELYPNYVSIHLVESRDTECPMHFRSIMKGAVNSFEPLVEAGGYSYT